jgi:hypothetical protein
LSVVQRGFQLRFYDLQHGIIRNIIYYMAFQNSLFGLVDKRSVKTHIRTVFLIFRIWTGVPDVVYLSFFWNFCFANRKNFCFANRKNFCFLIFQLCVMYYLQHERPCCMGYTNSSRRREFVYPIQHGRECCKWLKKLLIFWVHWRSNFKNKRCLRRENQS